jgi:hypothetical protein
MTLDGASGAHHPAIYKREQEDSLGNSYKSEEVLMNVLALNT